MLKKLIAIATNLDSMGLVKEADELDGIIKKIADEIIKLHEPDKPFDPSEFKFNFFKELDGIIKYIINNIREATIINRNEIELSDVTIKKLVHLHNQLKSEADDIDLEQLFDSYYNVWLNRIRSTVANIEPIAEKNLLSAYKDYEYYKGAQDRQGAMDALIEMDKQDRLKNIGIILGLVGDFVGGSILELIKSEKDMVMEPIEE